MKVRLFFDPVFCKLLFLTICNVFPVSADTLGACFCSGKFSWEHVLKYAKLRKRYISLYASLLKSDLSHMVADDNKEIEELDRELDIDVILQWRYRVVSCVNYGNTLVAIKVFKWLFTYPLGQFPA